LSLQDKLLLEQIKNISEEELISRLLTKKLKKLKDIIWELEWELELELEEKELYWTATEEELKQL